MSAPSSRSLPLSCSRLKQPRSDFTASQTRGYWGWRRFHHKGRGERWAAQVCSEPSPGGWGGGWSRAPDPAPCLTLAKPALDARQDSCPVRGHALCPLGDVDHGLWKWVRVSGSVFFRWDLRVFLQHPDYSVTTLSSPYFTWISLPDQGGNHVCLVRLRHPHRVWHIVGTDKYLLTVWLAEWLNE